MVDYLIATGGTGGHVFPAIALAKKLDNCAIVTDKRSTLHLNGSDVITDYIDICSPKSKIRFLFSFFRSVFQSFKLVKKHRPKKVICFGGYATLPILFISVLLGKKIILHESNTVMGRANKLFLPFAQKVLLGMPIKNVSGKKVALIGSPVRQEFVFSEYVKNKEQLNILVIGGSQGANFFAKVVPSFVIELAKKRKVKIIQQCKKDQIAQLINIYRQNNIDYEISDFFIDIACKVKSCHIAISRAGAISIAEILRVGRPAILIPYPNAKDNHQFFNAEFVHKQGMGIMIEQKDVNTSTFIKATEDIIKNLDCFLEKIKKSHFVQSDAIKNFIQAIA